jgi:predicted Zn-dependent peptidase
MKYHQHQLDNGLTVLAEVNDQAYTAAYGYFVKAGARDEAPQIAGVSHFLEHMVFKGTASRSAEDVNRFLDEIGSNSNARTAEESTIYHAAVLPEYQREIVEVLSDLMRPALRGEDFETEKQVIIEEIKMYADQPPYGGFERIMEEFFAGHPLGQSVLGTEKTVGALTPEQMQSYFQARYAPENIALAAAGNVDFQALVEQAERFCGHWTPFHSTRSLRTPDFAQGFVTMSQPNATQQYVLQLSPGPSVHEELRFAARVMTSIFGDDGSSRMYWELLDSGLAESAGVGVQEYDDCGTIMTYICCEPEQAQQNLERLKRLQQTATNSGFTERELELAKRKIASTIVLASEKTENRMFSVGSQWLTGRPFLSVAEIARNYEAVTLAQVNEVLRQFPFDRSVTLSVGPNSALKPL